MFVKTCAWCGETFTTKRSNAKYCCDRCRKDAHEHPGHEPMGSETIDVHDASVSTVHAALMRARTVSNDLAALSVAAPVQLRAGCRRISEAIARAIDEEGW